MTERTKKQIKEIKFISFITLVIVLIAIMSVGFCVFSESPAPEASENVPSATQEVPSATESPTTPPVIVETASPTPTPTPTPTPSAALDYLYDFTVPPLNDDGASNITLAPETTATPGMSDATIDVVQVDIIEKKRDFRLSDIIKYIAYGFFGLAVIAVLYGLVCMASLIFFKKDITLSGIKQRKKKKK